MLPASPQAAPARAPRSTADHTVIPQTSSLRRPTRARFERLRGETRYPVPAPADRGSGAECLPRDDLDDLAVRHLMVERHDPPFTFAPPAPVRQGRCARCKRSRAAWRRGAGHDLALGRQRVARSSNSSVRMRSRKSLSVSAPGSSSQGSSRRRTHSILRSYCAVRAPPSLYCQ